MAMLRPLRVTRLANCAPGVALALLGVWAANQTRLAAGLVLLAVAVGSAIVIRGYRMGVTVTATDVVVRGLLRSRTVPQSAVLGVGTVDVLALRVPTLRWRSAQGNTRRTPITAFGQSGFPPTAVYVRRHHEACVERLASLLKAPIDVSAHLVSDES